MVNLLSLARGRARAPPACRCATSTTGGYVFFATRQGKVKKTELAAYSHPQRGRHPGHHARGGRRGHGGAAHRRPARGAARHQGRAWPSASAEEEVRPMGRAAAGVKRHRGRGRTTQVIAADVVQEGATDPHGDRARLRQAHAARRVPASGARAARASSTSRPAGRNGRWSGMLQVREGDDMLLVTTKGKMIRLHADDVSLAGPQHDGRAHHRPRRRRPGRAASRASRPSRRRAERVA